MRSYAPKRDANEAHSVAVLGVDPDPLGGTVVALDGEGAVVWHHRQEPVHDLVNRIRNTDKAHLSRVAIAVEVMQSYGMPVGLSVFESCYRIGELMLACKDMALEPEGPVLWPVTRKQVVSSVCGKANAKDKNVRAALIDLYPPTGGGKVPQIGTKAQPGPLYGLAADEWSALAIGLTCLASRKQGPLWARDNLPGAERLK